MRSLLVLFGIIVSASAGRAANIEIRPLGTALPQLIVVYGELVQADAERFQTIAALAPKAVVAFAGPGGSIVAGTGIGEIIRLKNFDTVVLDGDQCASACALAWLGGARRYLAEGAKIGFHAAHDARSGDVSGIGNALVGAYLNKIGLPTQAIVYITAAAPNAMLWLNLSDAQAYGIDVELLPAQSTGQTATAEDENTTSPLQIEAIEFVMRHAAAQSAPAKISLASVQTHYADTVFYYGKYLDAAAVLKEYQTFIERWPQRQYGVRAETVEARCFPGSNVCNVTAIIDWVAVSQRRGKKSAGHSTWTLGLVRKNGVLVIASVNGTVLNRQITDLSAGTGAVDSDLAERAFGRR
jgi:hypothetical protein